MRRFLNPGFGHVLKKKFKQSPRQSLPAPGKSLIADLMASAFLYVSGETAAPAQKMEDQLHDQFVGRNPYRTPHAEVYFPKPPFPSSWPQERFKTFAQICLGQFSTAHSRVVLAVQANSSQKHQPLNRLR